MGLKGFLSRHSVSGFFLLAIAISWAGIVLLVGPGGIPATTKELEDLGGVVYFPMLVGPSVAAVLFIRLASGRGAPRNLASRLVAWRSGARWYAIAALTFPVIAAATLLPLSVVASSLRPELLVTDDNKLAFLTIGVAVGIMVGIFEEIGWTGFALPRLMERHGVLASGLLVGLVWGVWHLLLMLLNSGDSSGGLDLALFMPSLVFCLVVLPTCRVLMTWLYSHTRSVVLAVVMHASLTGGVAMILIPLDGKAWPLVTWYLVLAAGVWIITAAVLYHDTRSQPKLSTATSPR
jgi:membrane protease YdiL (CAAX protease family)